jgi:antitoxin VapB
MVVGQRVYAGRMAVLIKDNEADRLIRELAERTGETITDAVKTSVRERLSEQQIAERKRRIRVLLAELDGLPTTDHRSAEEILGYDEHGLLG